MGEQGVPGDSPTPAELWVILFTRTSLYPRRLCLILSVSFIRSVTGTEFSQYQKIYSFTINYLSFATLLLVQVSILFEKNTCRIGRVNRYLRNSRTKCRLRDKIGVHEGRAEGQCYRPPFIVLSSTNLLT